MVVVAVCLGGTAAVWGASIHVPANYTSIQNAINAAANGDEVVIAPGRYVERINFLGKAITVRGCDPNDPAMVSSTIIVGYNGNGDLDPASSKGCDPVVSFVQGEGADSQLLGLTITGGVAPVGAGILCDGASPTIQHNIITNNGVQYFLVDRAAKQPQTVGGGIALLHGASPLISNNEISLNFAELGGGIFASGSTTRPTIKDNTITANTAFLGGGIFADLGAVLTVEGNKFGTAANGVLTSQTSAMKAKADAARQKKTAVGDAKAKAARAADADYVRKARKPSAESVAKLQGARKFSYSGNVAVVGGAMYLYSCEVALNDNVFTSNSAVDFGGAISGWELCLDSCNNVFDRNFTDDIDDGIFDDFGFGGAIDLVYGQADFSNDRFTYNTSGGGGAISIDSGSIVVKDCVFDHNMANDFGGAIAAVGFEDEDFTAAVECSTFTHNSAYDGGAIAAYSPTVLPFSPFNVIECTFDSNTAICGSGGAVYVEDGVEMQLAKSIFQDNAADYYGSAVANINALLTLEDSTLTGNLGADYCYGTVYVEGEEEDNVDVAAAAAAPKGLSGDETVIQRNSFIRNINFVGAGVYVDSGEVLITCNSFKENTVNGEGGAIYWANSNDHGWISYNSFIGNSASRGGAIFIAPESRYVEIQHNKLTGNIAGTAGGLGGGIFLASNADVKHNTFCSNSAGYQGGAIYIGQPEIVETGIQYIRGCGARIKNNSFSDNWALEGGTIFSALVNGIPVSTAGAKSDEGAVIKNNIIAFSKRGCGVWFEGTAPYFAYNNVFGNVPNNYCNVQDLTGIDGNISVDPLFADRATCNLYLKSVAGRFDPATGEWVRDTVTSRSIDAGDPSSDWECEPEENGGIINQGAQGNTRWASKSSMFAAVVFAAGQDGVSRSGPYKFIFFNNVVRDSVTARMNVYQDNSLCSTAKQITSGVVWTGKNKLAFSPFEPLAAATGYRIIFGANIRLCNGNTIPWAENFPIVTGVEPVVAAISPSNGECSAPTDSVISVNFDQSMRASSVENCFGIKPRVAGTFEWNEECSAFDFVPNAPLAAGVTYTVTIGANSRDAEGDPMLRAFCWSFHTGSFNSDSAAAAVTATAASTSAGASITVNLASAATVSASIRNLAGVEIATVAPRALDSGVSTLLWNGKSKSGTNVPAGKYMVSVTAAKADGTQANALTTLQR